MKQLLQNIRSGETSVVEVPVPAVRAGTALVRVHASLVSAGTERMVVEFAEKSLVGKARSRPDLVRQVLDKARREGLIPTIEAAFNRLDQPMTLGYSSAGEIVAVGEGLKGFQVGDRVACSGGGFAAHAEYNLVPQNLLTRLPDSVRYEAAAFTTLGSIALHGFRLARPQVGERVAVIGMGLLGLLTAGIARAAGCEVLGVELNPARIELARRLGYTAATPEAAVEIGAAITRQMGFDAVLICADARGNQTVELAGLLARDRAVVVAVGAVGMDLPRKIYYEKELQFLISRSYGPGRYDPQYEERGLDYPPGYVRWTEGRNFEAFLQLLGSGKLDIEPLISHRFPIDQAADAYRLITGKTGEAFLGVLLTYPGEARFEQTIRLLPDTTAAPASALRGLGVLGAGNYASAVFLPVVRKVGRIPRRAVATSSGLTARHAADRHGFETASSDENNIFNDPEIDVVAILTRHNQHARQILQGLQRGKAVFCEKPLAISAEEVESIAAALAENPQARLMVGFNRRFAPLSTRLKAWLENRSEPLYAHYRVNAGYLPPSHWLHDPAQGGGRLIGEGCHFVDYLTFLTGQLPLSVSASALPDQDRYRQDNFQITFTYPDGSVGTLTYLANGDKAFPKERVEVFCGGKVAVLDDFRSLECVSGGRKNRYRHAFSQEKGHRQGWQAFLDFVEKGGQPPIPYAELIGVARACLAAQDALTSRNSVQPTE